MNKINRTNSRSNDTIETYWIIYNCNKTLNFCNQKGESKCGKHSSKKKHQGNCDWEVCKEVFHEVIYQNHNKWNT